MTFSANPAVDLETVVSSFGCWLDEHGSEVAALEGPLGGDVADVISRARPALRALYDGGWTRLGWPVSVGGIGGSPIQRAAVFEALSAAGYTVPEVVGTIEIIGSMLVRFAPDLAADAMPPALRGDEMWCQGFSEPDAGSDLGSLRTRAVRDGDGFVITGQKMWSSFGHASRRCALLARTGDPESRYKGLTMFWVDLQSPGVTVVPTACASGRYETAEIFLDDVRVPDSAVIGQVGEGWAAVMYLMQYEGGVRLVRDKVRCAQISAGCSAGAATYQEHPVSLAPPICRCSRCGPSPPPRWRDWPPARNWARRSPWTRS